MGFFMSHVILAFIFYAVITPLGLALRFLFGKDFLAMTLDGSVASYWRKRDLDDQEEKRSRYEQQF